MELVDVYRVETESGAGPYIGAHVPINSGVDVFSHEYDARHPSPYTDRPLMQGPPTEDKQELTEWAQYFGKGMYSDEEYTGVMPTIDIVDGERCGFWSLSQLKDWFDHSGNRANLEGLEHGITHYKVPADQLRYGVRQVVFAKASAKFHARLSFEGVLA